MTVAAKICGLSTPETVEAAVLGGADFIGFVFFPRSPRYVTPEQAFVLGRDIPRHIRKAGLFVDASDDVIDQCLKISKIDMLQLHGGETAERCAYLRRRYALPVMKAIKIATAEDLEAAHVYEGSTDWLVFDARPANEPSALPGGNGLVFDWTLLKDRHWSMPWMLSGGLNAGNIEMAVQISGARTIDVSSGVETSPGVKDPTLIRGFLARAKSLS